MYRRLMATARRGIIYDDNSYGISRAHIIHDEGGGKADWLTSKEVLVMGQMIGNANDADCGACGG